MPETMDLEVVLDGQIVECRKVGDDGKSPEEDERAFWASKLEGRARELFGFDQDRVVFRQNGEGIVLVADRESKISLMKAIQEEYEHMPVHVKTFSLDVMRILENH